MLVSWRAVTARRLTRHGLVVPFPDAPSAVSAMVGAHAQVLSAAELAIGLRTADSTTTTVRDALWRDRTLIKTFGPRGTVHLVTAGEFRPWLAAFSNLTSRTAPIAGVSLSDSETDAVVAAIDDALTRSGAAGLPLTTQELGDEVIARVGDWAGELTFPAFDGFWPRWRQAIATAAYRGVLCFGPQRGARVTYTRPLDASGAERLTGDDAVLWLLRRYLDSYGPASPAEFARWLAVPVRRAQELFALADLDAVTIDDSNAPDPLAGTDREQRWINAGDGTFPDEGVRGIRLLPYFDPFIVGSHPRSLLFPGAAQRAMPSGSAGNFPVLLVDGVAGGIWHAKRSGKHVVITVESLVRLTKQHSRELDEQVQRVGELLGAAPELALGPVPVGPHA
ncbi:MAG TPA: winged helix DNA-binding domain-containing protein [Terrimesophilobacter sp.]|nr:winged helix DNA-binding domain-containing protein [Terrimesophilobacter sp.]